MTGHVLVVGGSIEGVQAALDIANSGLQVTIAEESSSIGQSVDLFLQPKLLEAANHPNINILTGTDITNLEGERGSFHVRFLEHPRYVDTDVCTSCGRCEQSCPVVVTGPRGSKAHKAIHFPQSGLKSVPSTCMIEKTGIAPCTAACPAGINVQGYVALISKGKLREALDLIREAVPFPHILGRVCTHPCEDVCTRRRVDQPLAIASLKRYLADMEPSQYTLMPTDVVAPDTPSRVAIIGSGPAGLTCAWDLVRMGHNSTIFEALPVPGGMVAVGMPRFRLPHEVREAEINAITNLGIEIKKNMPLGNDLTLDDLQKQGYEAIFIASGAHKNETLGIPGEDLHGVIESIGLLRKVNLKQYVKIGNNVVVIGGGYTAIDSARTAIRLGCKDVRIVYRRTADEMYATKAEILETIEEGVDMTFLSSPLSIVGENGKVTGIECQEMKLGEPDESGRRRPFPVEGSTFIIECDTVVVAIGQSPDLEIFEHGKIRPENNGKTLTVDPLTLGTNMHGIFAGGDVVHGPRSMVEAVGDGRRAAESIDRLLRGEDMKVGRTYERPTPIEVNLDEVKIVHRGRRRIPVLPARQRIKSFEEVETGYTTFMALRESKRCLSCGGCSECMECVRQCELEAVKHEMVPVETELEVGAIVFAQQPSRELPKDGVYVIGQGDGPGRLTNASAVASKAIVALGRHAHEGAMQKQIPVSILELHKNDSDVSMGEARIGVFICGCGGNISEAIDVNRIIRQFFRQKGIAYAQHVDYACSDEGAWEIRGMAREWELTHIVVAACACCALDQICFSCADRRIECKEKLLGHAQDDGLVYEFVNIREHCAWVHIRQPERAFEKARSLIRAGISRVTENKLLEGKSFVIEQNVVVIGSGLSGLQAANDLASMGIKTTVIDSGKSQKDKKSDELRQELIDKLRQNGANLLANAQLKDVRGSIGQFLVSIKQQGASHNITAGSLVIDTDVVTKKRLPPLLEIAVKHAINQNESDEISSCVPGIFLCGDMDKKDMDATLMRGSAAASRASALLGKGIEKSVQTFAIIDPVVCRGCGTCTTICEFGAASLIEQSPGVFVSKIDEAICRGCGTCVAHCPSGAICQNGLDDNQIAASLEALLTPF
ncbi:MAG: FAD-dependent oxidoreductase [Chloroflexi bacterium]|nr:FAD-dependent oxidoreductase [Chloroflexota bacterium]